MTAGRTAAALLVAALAAAGCTSMVGGKAELPERRKFIIEAMPLPLALPTSERPYPYRLEVQEFAVSRLYEKDQIVFRLSPEEIREDRWHVWAVRPGQMITDAVEQYLRNASLFADIRQEYIDTSPDFTLSGTINAIERWDSGDEWYARLAITMQMTDRSNQVVWRRIFGEKAQQVYAPDFSHTVEAMKGRLRQYMKQAIPEIDLQIHIRMLQERHLPYEYLLAVRGEKAAAGPDTTVVEGRIPGSHPHYEILPGRLTPDAD